MSRGGQLPGGRRCCTGARLRPPSPNRGKPVVARSAVSWPHKELGFGGKTVPLIRQLEESIAQRPLRPVRFNGYARRVSQAVGRISRCIRERRDKPACCRG